MSDEQAQQLMHQMQALENYFVELNRKEESLISIIREAASAIQSIKALKEQPDSSTLVRAAVCQPEWIGAPGHAPVSTLLFRQPVDSPN